ncbi:methyl-accepting chemotaxis protein [Hydrogenophaga sp. 5NK40-0174]|uniref:methyl-accepting chemotaxis protein n=1 Tax=Hydrogenophaga sp. 5NK40-0174 TaxID=3127649 RepID=UPI003107A436
MSRQMTLKSKFTIGLIAVALVAVVLMVGVRLLSKTARFHYLEREHLAQILTLQHRFDTVTEGGRSAGEVRKDEVLSLLDEAIRISGSVDEELFAPEVTAFRLLGFSPVVDLPVENMVYLKRVRGVVTAQEGEFITPLTATRVAQDVATSRRLGDSFGPLVAGATDFVKVLVVGLNLAGIAVVLGTFVMIRRATLKPIAQAVEAARLVAEGDLSGRNLRTANDEIGQLNDAINEMRKSLTSVVGDVRERSHAVASSMKEVSQGSGDLSSRTEQQAATLQQAVGSVSQLSESIRHIGQQIREVNGQARETGSVAGDGGRSVEELVARMDEILAATHKVADINGVIDGIAFQTNILALNAAVEAARAGEQGRGFAVVASEVRSLAKRSAEAAKEIASLIADTVEKVEQGAREAGAAGQTIGQVVTSVDRVSQLVAEVDNVLSAQEHGLGQIDQAMSALESGTQQNASMAEQSAAAAESVNALTERLVNSVGRFRLSQEG